MMMMMMMKVEALPAGHFLSLGTLVKGFRSQSEHVHHRAVSLRALASFGRCYSNCCQH